MFNSKQQLQPSNFIDDILSKFSNHNKLIALIYHPSQNNQWLVIICLVNEQIQYEAKKESDAHQHMQTKITKSNSRALNLQLTNINNSIAAS